MSVILTIPAQFVQTGCDELTLIADGTIPVSASFVGILGLRRKIEGKVMAENKPSREQLIHRRDELIKQLERVYVDERIELDRDPEEQAIEIEQNQVATSLEKNLRRELAVIEDALLDGET
jgi:hypothetical protein